VQTRLARLEEGLADCTLLARAGLNRLGMAGIGTPLDSATWLPAPGQGAIAIECRTADAELRGLLAAIDHQPSHRAVMAERALLGALGGTCHSPIAALTRFDGDLQILQAAIFSADGQQRIAGEARFAPGDPAGPADLAAELLLRASPEVRQLFEGT
jgi:hydroxymethylbilane synthase